MLYPGTALFVLYIMMLSRLTDFHFQNAAAPDCLFVFDERFAVDLDTSFFM